MVQVAGKMNLRMSFRADGVGGVGVGGGGRPNMAQAGGKNPAGIEAALEEAVKVLEGQL